MEVDALSKGKRKGKKGSFSFRKEKGRSWTVNRGGHRTKNGPERKARVKVRAKARAS